jgi:hypothetical protein
MATQQYMNNRKRYSRPQAVLFADNPPVFLNGVARPPGFELSSDYGENDPLENSFIILSDHNRAPINISYNKIENRQRMVNAQMRSFFIGEKRTVELSWERLPSRAFATNPDFSQTTGLPDIVTSASVDNDNDTTTPNVVRSISSSGSRYFADQQYTVDGGAGGAELLAWYQNHRGPFWVYLSYDNFATYGYEDANYARLANYTDFYFMYATSFNYSIEKRGADNFDMWNVSITLEEV